MSTELEREQWRGFIKRMILEKRKYNGNEEPWGDVHSSRAVDSVKKPLGNYKKIRNFLHNYVNKDSVVLEIGCLYGKWSCQFAHVKKIICVDLFEESFFYIKKIKKIRNAKFYLSKGNELFGVSNDSVDLVFTMDSLVKADREDILSYISESIRVIKKGGLCFLHIPISESMESIRRNFTKVSRIDIQNILLKYKNLTFEFRDDFLLHGIILIIKKL